MMRRLYMISCMGLLLSCNADYSPKPKAYHRIAFPDKQYSLIIVDGCPFEFEIPSYSILTNDLGKNSKPCWKNVDFKAYNARLHLSYFTISSQAPLSQLTEDARSFVFKHTSKATAIDQQTIETPQHQLYGLKYNIQGNTASNFQFYVTDNETHYLRGALYFNEKPNLDSIQPVLDFLKSDINHLINTIRWK